MARRLSRETVLSHIPFEKALSELSEGGQRVPLFVCIDTPTEATLLRIWANAFLIAPASVPELEKSPEVEVYEYLQCRAHPEVLETWDGKPLEYKGIYGKPIEPLALGWSADESELCPDLSQEFERHFRLTRGDTETPAGRIRWIVERKTGEVGNNIHEHEARHGPGSVRSCSSRRQATICRAPSRDALSAIEKKD